MKIALILILSSLVLTSENASADGLEDLRAKKLLASQQCKDFACAYKIETDGLCEDYKCVKKYREQNNGREVFINSYRNETNGICETYKCVLDYRKQNSKFKTLLTNQSNNSTSTYTRKSNTFEKLINNIPDEIIFPFSIFAIISFFTFFSGFKEHSKHTGALKFLAVCVIFPFAMMGLALIRALMGGI